MKVELLFFPGCPHVPAAREQLSRAFAAVGVAPSWEEVDVTAADAPQRVRGYGSPTIFVDGKDVTGAPPGDGTACRLYLGSDRAGAPPLEVLVAALGASGRS